MIAVDTNVLLRYLLEDDARQAPVAARLIQGEELVLITDVVLAEALWTLTGRKYSASREDLAGVVATLFEEPAVRFEDADAVWVALGDFQDSDADFQDALIIRKAEGVAKALEEPWSGCFTFDSAALGLEGARQPH